MNILSCNFKVFVGVSYLAFSHMYPCSSSLAARKSFLTRKADIASRKEEAVNFDTFAGTVHQPYPLSKEEAFSFVENVLGLKHPDTLFTTDPLQNLTKITKRLKKVSPFTTMHFFDGSVLQINDEYCKGQMLQRHGGSCMVINPFTKALLEQLGYKTYDVAARTAASTDYCHHISTLVCDVCHPGSVHLVEPGASRPIFDPISLDFEQESPVYEVYGLRNKFFKHDNGSLVWGMEPSPKMLNRLGDHEVVKDSTGQKWQIYLIYFLQDKTARYHFHKYWHKLRRCQAYIPFRAKGFVYSAYKDGKLIDVYAGKHKILVQIFQEDSTKQEQEFTKEELMRFFEKNFPGFPTRMVERSIRDNFRMSQVSNDL